MSEIQVIRAEAIATIAHRGQVDKGGNPYIQHPYRVAKAVREAGGDEYDIATAWLHDVIEDTDITATDLHEAGITWPVANAVDTLSRKSDVSIEDYYAGIRISTRALKVKLADIADNTNVDRLALLDDATVVRLTRKYAKARRLLGAS